MYLTRDTRDINSLVDFVSETKPYHTKIKEILVEYQWDDALRANISDHTHIFTELTSAWGGLGWKYLNRRHFFSKSMPLVDSNLHVGDSWIQPIRNLNQYDFDNTSNVCIMNKIKSLYSTLGFDVPSIDETGINAGFSTSGGQPLTAGYDTMNLDRGGLESVGLIDDEYTEVGAEKWLPKIGIIRNYTGIKRDSTSLDTYYTSKNITISLNYLINNTVDFSVVLINRNNLQVVDPSTYSVSITTNYSTTTTNYIFDFTFSTPFNGIIHIDYPNWSFEDYCLISDQAPKWFDNKYIEAYDLKWYDTYHDRVRIYTDNNVCGNHRMNGQADGSAKYKYWRLPSTVFPRYSDNEHEINFIGVVNENSSFVQPEFKDSYMIYEPQLLNVDGTVATYKAVFNFRYRFDNSVSLDSVKHVFFGIPQSTSESEFTYERAHTNLDDLQPNNAKEWTVTHNLNSSSIEIRCYNNLGQQIYPIDIQFTDLNTFKLVFEYAQYSGRCVVQKYGKYDQIANTDWHVYYDDTPSKQKLVAHQLNQSGLAVSFQDKMGNDITKLVDIKEANNNSLLIESETDIVGKLVFKTADALFSGLSTTSKKLSIQHARNKQVIPFVWCNGKLIEYKRIRDDGTTIEILFDKNYSNLTIGLIDTTSIVDVTAMKRVEVTHAEYSYDSFVIVIDENGNVINHKMNMIDARKFVITADSAFTGKILYAIDDKGVNSEYVKIDGFEKFGHDIMINNVEMIFTYDAIGDKLSYPFFYTKYLEYMEAKHNGTLSVADLLFSEYIESMRYLGFRHNFYIDYGSPNRIREAISKSLLSFLSSTVGSQQEYIGDVSTLEINILNTVIPHWIPSISNALEQSVVAVTNNHLIDNNNNNVVDKTALLSYLTYSINVISGITSAGDATEIINNATAYLKSKLDSVSFALINPASFMASYINARISLTNVVYNELAHIKHSEWDKVNQKLNSITIADSDAMSLIQSLNNDIQQRFLSPDINSQFINIMKESITSVLAYADVIKQAINRIINNVYQTSIANAIDRMINQGSIGALSELLNALVENHLVTQSNSFIGSLKSAELNVKFSKIFENDLTFSILDKVPGQYVVPWNNGAHVYVNGILQIEGTDYYFEDADTNRSKIQFITGKFPLDGDEIHINLMICDRFYMSYVKPSDPEHPINCGNGEKWIDFNVVEKQNGFDTSTYDLMPYSSHWDEYNSLPNYNEAFVINTLNFGSQNANTRLNPFGVIRYVKENGQTYYMLELNEIPEAGTIIRLRVEQATQLKAVVRTEIKEKIRFNDSVRFTDTFAAGFVDVVKSSKEYTRFVDSVYGTAVETYDKLKNVVETTDYQGFDRQGFGSLGFDNGTYGNTWMNGYVSNSEFNNVENRPATGFMIKLIQSEQLNTVMVDAIFDRDPVWFREIANVVIHESPIPKISLPVKFIDTTEIAITDSEISTSVQDSSDDVIGATITELFSVTVREVGMDAINLDITGLGAEFDGPAPNP